MHEKVIEIYNKGQDEYAIDIKKDVSGDYVVFITETKDNETFMADFYEWLFGPKYKVFEVFPQLLENESMTGNFLFMVFTRGKLNYLKKQPAEILRYLSEGGI